MKTPPPGIRVDLPFDAPPITKNKVRRLHYQAEAKMRRERSCPICAMEVGE